MTIITVFYLKLLISFVLSAAIFVIINKSELFAKWQNKGDKTVIISSFILSRFIPWVVIFVIANEDPRGDIPFFFYKAEAVIKGGFVYRDFWSYHAPLYAYIISLPVWIWYNSKAIVLFMILTEGVILWLTYDTYKARNPNALQLAVIYFLLPASFVNTLIGGQEEVWFWGIALLMWRLTLKKNENYEVGLGLLFAIALLTIKITFVLLLPAVLVMVRKPWKMLAVMAAIGLPVIALLYWKIGTLFLMPIQHTEQLMTPNLFSVSRPFIETFVHISEKKSTMVNWLGLLFTVFIPVFMAVKAKKRHISEILPGIFIACFSSMVIFQASAISAYLIAFLMTVLFEIIDIRKTWPMLILLCINVLTIAQPFVWVYLKQPAYTSFSMFSNPHFLFEYILQILNVAGFAWILYKVYQHVVYGKSKQLI